MVTQNKTWRFSKRIKNDNYNVSEGEGEFSGVMILLHRGRSAAKCSSAIHYSYHFVCNSRVVTGNYIGDDLQPMREHDTGQG